MKRLIFCVKCEILHAKRLCNSTGYYMETEKFQERDNIYMVELEMADFSKEEIKVYFNDGYLVVTAESRILPKKSKRHAFYIGCGVAQDNIRAAFHNGILKCIIPKDDKKEGQNPVEIEIM